MPVSLTLLAKEQLTAISDHAQNLLFWTWIQDLAIFITCVSALEILQQSRIVNAILRLAAVRSDAAFRLLHDGSEDESVVDS